MKTLFFCEEFLIVLESFRLLLWAADTCLLYGGEHFESRGE